MAVEVLQAEETRDVRLVDGTTVRALHGVVAHADRVPQLDPYARRNNRITTVMA